MRFRIFVLGLAIGMSGLVGAVPAQWTAIQTGFDLGEFSVPSGDRAFVTRMALDDVSARALDSAIAQGQFYKSGLPSEGRETVSSMVARYNDSIGYYYQNWGVRYDIIAMVNGDYWEREYLPNGPFTSRPSGGQVQSGWFCRRFPGFSGGSGFFYTVWGTPALGGDVWNGDNNQARQTVTFQDDSVENLTKLNLERDGTDDLVLYTPQWGATTATDNSGVEVLARVNRPALPLPPNVATYSCTGTILEVNDGVGSTAIPFDCVVLSASGSEAAVLRNRCVVGETVRLYMTIRDYGFSGRTPVHDPQNWEKAYGSIGVDRELLINGQVTNLPSPDTVRRARTGLAYNEDHLYLVVVEESAQDGNHGATFQELAVFMRDSLSADFGCSSDGGGSSAMWVKGNGIVNNPSDSSERATCNGVFLAAVEPMAQDNVYTDNQEVHATSTASVRTGPGENFPELTTVASGTSGHIVAHSKNGIRASGQNWWQWTDGTVTGWSSESEIEGVMTYAPSWVLY